MTAFWPEGVPIRVEADGWAQPLTLLWGRQRHRVRQISDSWRVETGWWREPVCRDYFVVRTDTGWLLVLFHDHLHEGWYLQRGYS